MLYTERIAKTEISMCIRNIIHLSSSDSAQRMVKVKDTDSEAKLASLVVDIAWRSSQEKKLT